MDDTGVRWYFYLLLAILIIVGGFFAASETAYSYCNRARYKTRSDDGDKKAKRVQYILDRFDSTIITVLIGTNITHIVASTLATIVAVYIFGDIGSIVSTVIMTVIVFLFSETIPKNIAKANADKMSELFAIPIIGLMYLFTPLVWIFNTPFKYLMDKIKNDDLDYTEEDLQSIVETVEEEGGLDEGESSLIQSAIEFDDIPVKSVFTPVKKVVAVDIETDREMFIKEVLMNQKFSRIPVYKDNIDNIIGVLHVRTCLKELLENPEVSLRSLMTEPYVIEPSMKLDDIVEGFSERRTHMAIVKRDNKTLGIVTMNDALRELIGDMLESEDDDNE